MLIKRNHFMTAKTNDVKKLTRSAFFILGICTAAIAPAAFASDSLLVEKTVTVKFRLSELNAEGGDHKIYAKIKKRATSACRADSATLQYYGHSRKDCVDDLIDQFVESANIDTLTSFHLSEKPVTKTTKLALN